MTQRLERQVFADYFQFLLLDEPRADAMPDVSWKGEAMHRCLWAGPGAIVVMTARNMDVPVVVEVVDRVPGGDFGGSDLVNEATLDVTGTHVILSGNSDYLPDCPRLVVAPGRYRVRTTYRGLGTVSADGLEGQDS
jgi:hypothetical protein